MNIKIFKDQVEYGPYSVEEVYSYLSEGSILRTDLAWHDGMPEWLPLENLISIPQPQASTAKNFTPHNLPTGIRGWLLLFCLRLVTLAPIFAVTSLYTAFSNYPYSPDGVHYFRVILSIYGIFTAIWLWRLKEQGARHARRYLKAELAVGILSGLMLTTKTPMSPFAWFLQILLSFIWYVIWIKYFEKSKQVKALFPATFDSVKQ